MSQRMVRISHIKARMQEFLAFDDLSIEIDFGA